MIYHTILMRMILTKKLNKAGTCQGCEEKEIIPDYS
jgi:hypothetical protein